MMLNLMIQYETDCLPSQDKKRFLQTPLQNQLCEACMKQIEG